MKIETKIFSNGETVSNKNFRKGENPLFFYFDFDTIPQVGETIIMQDSPGGMFIVAAVIHCVTNGKGFPNMVWEKIESDTTRQSVLERYGWLKGQEMKPNAFENERLAIEN